MTTPLERRKELAEQAKALREKFHRRKKREAQAKKRSLAALTKNVKTYEDLVWWETALKSKLREIVTQDGNVVGRCKASASARLRNQKRRQNQEPPDDMGDAWS